MMILKRSPDLGRLGYSVMLDPRYLVSYPSKAVTNKLTILGSSSKQLANLIDIPQL